MPSYSTIVANVLSISYPVIHNVLPRHSKFIVDLNIKLLVNYCHFIDDSLIIFFGKLSSVYY